jgi:hypothetical protein
MFVMARDRLRAPVRQLARWPHWHSCSVRSAACEWPTVAPSGLQAGRLRGVDAVVLARRIASLNASIVIESGNPARGKACSKPDLPRTSERDAPSTCRCAARRAEGNRVRAWPGDAELIAPTDARTFAADRLGYARAAECAGRKIDEARDRATCRRAR